MGDHRHNPRAIATSQPRPFRVEQKQPEISYGFQLELTIEPNAEARARMEAENQLLMDSGAPPRVYRLSDFADDEKDLVVFKAYGVTRTKTPGGLDLTQPVSTAIRRGEFDRRPLTEVLELEGESLGRYLGTQKLVEG